MPSLDLFLLYAWHLALQGSTTYFRRDFQQEKDTRDVFKQFDVVSKTTTEDISWIVWQTRGAICDYLKNNWIRTAGGLVHVKTFLTCMSTDMQSIRKKWGVEIALWLNIVPCIRAIQVYARSGLHALKKGVMLYWLVRFVPVKNSPQIAQSKSQSRNPAGRESRRCIKSTFKSTFKCWLNVYLM